MTLDSAWGQGRGAWHWIQHGAWGGGVVLDSAHAQWTVRPRLHCRQFKRHVTLEHSHASRSHLPHPPLTTPPHLHTITLPHFHTITPPHPLTQSHLHMYVPETSDVTYCTASSSRSPPTPSHPPQAHLHTYPHTLPQAHLHYLTHNYIYCIRTCSTANIHEVGRGMSLCTLPLALASTPPVTISHTSPPSHPHPITPSHPPMPSTLTFSWLWTIE